MIHVKNIVPIHDPERCCAHELSYLITSLVIILPLSQTQNSLEA
jgi:hypothetical protein